MPWTQKTSTSHKASPPPTHNDYTIGVVCALPVEKAAVAAMLDEQHDALKPIEGDGNSYTLGRIGVHNIVVACLPAGMTGNNSAATVANDMKRSYPIKFGLMIGVGGGVPTLGTDIRLGDVVVSKPDKTHGGVVQWDFGKMEHGRGEDGGPGFQRTGSLNKPPRVLLNALVELQAKHWEQPSKLPEYLSAMLARKPSMVDKFGHQGTDNDVLFHAAYPHRHGETCHDCDREMAVQRKPRSSLAPVIHYGNIASGNEVIKDGPTRDKIAKREGIICFEMEAAGLMDTFPCMVIRGICDYADSHKNKRWQPYAAATAAAFAKELLGFVNRHEVDEASPAKAASPASPAPHPETRSRPGNQLRAHLKSTDPRSDKLRIENAQGRPLKDSYSWILDHADFRRWQENPGSRLLWVKSGLGKIRTTVVCGIIDDLHRPRLAPPAGGVAFAFCQGADSQPNTAAGVLRGLMYSLVRQQPSLESYIEEDYHDTGRELFEDADALCGALDLMLGDPEAHGYYIVIDDLDPCQPGFSQLARFIVQAVSRHGHLKWVVSSRNIPDIEKVFLELDGPETMISIKLDKHNVGQAINGYIERQVSTLKSPQGMAALRILDTNTPVLEAAAWGYETVVELLLDKGADANEKGADGLTPLAHAAMNGHDAVARLLLDRGADIEAKGDRDARPLLYATAGGHEAVVKVLLEKRADTEAKRTDGVAALVAAAALNNAAIAKLLIEGGADLETRTKEGITPLIQAVVQGHDKVARLLLDQGAEINARGPHGTTAFGHAVQMGHEALVALLLDHGANIEEKHTDGITPLLRAASLGQESIARLLIKKGANIEVKSQDGAASLLEAASSGHEAIVRLLLDEGADVETKDNDGLTSLWCAALGGHEAVVKLLLSKGANLGVRGQSSSQTALLAASIRGHKAIVKLLLENGADTEDKDNRDTTPLWYAAAAGHEAIVRLLISHKANLEARPAAHGITALWNAVAAQNGSMVRLLLEKCADIEALDANDLTPLMYAAHQGLEDMVQLLLEEGAKVEGTDALPTARPLLMASRNGYAGIVRLLLRHGADVNGKLRPILDPPLSPLAVAVRNGHTAVEKVLLENGAKKSGFMYHVGRFL